MMNHGLDQIGQALILGDLLLLLNPALLEGPLLVEPAEQNLLSSGLVPMPFLAILITADLAFADSLLEILILFLLLLAKSHGPFDVSLGPISLYVVGQPALLIGLYPYVSVL
jgi:hypothetical protein